MKIDDQNSLGGVSSPATKGASAVEANTRREAGRGVERAGSDRAELSGLAGKISNALGQEADKRAEKVERIRLQVAEGSYHPDPADISKGIVNDALASIATAGGNQDK